MIVDASALLAVLFDEAERTDFADLIIAADAAAISSVNWLEAAIRVDRLNDPSLSTLLDQLCAELQLQIIAPGREIADKARSAYARFGRGSGHGAQLNLGDCFAYATAAALDRPLLFKGDDFSRTDVLTVRR